MPYFLRIASDPTTPAIPFDWKMAQEEVMRADLSNDPIQAAIARLERQVIINMSLGHGCNVLILLILISTAYQKMVMLYLWTFKKV